MLRVPVPPADGQTTYKQRFYVCDKYWHKSAVSDTDKGPIFFYVGNEADVTLYLNNTGLMWESAAEFHALLVFAEHRYYGESKPYSGSKLRNNMQYLTAEQAMADYAELIAELKSDVQAEQSPVIGFGGSYGGMLASWMRMKYPHVLDGAIAGSAPIWAFPGEDPPVDPGAFAKIVTRDATPAGGSAKACAGNLRNAWKQLKEWGSNDAGRGQIKEAMQLCPAANLSSDDDAMGDYPYPSNYMLNGQGVLPAYPMRAAWGGRTLLVLLARAHDTAKDDMFWKQPWDLKAFGKQCKEQWGVTPRPYWAQI
ncbi:MAG: lysosomal Pro-X, partial [Trebouxia sp. A1-2]